MITEINNQPVTDPAEFKKLYERGSMIVGGIGVVLVWGGMQL
jgi:hypothetical protein